MTERPWGSNQGLCLTSLQMSLMMVVEDRAAANNTAEWGCAEAELIEVTCAAAGRADDCYVARIRRALESSLEKGVFACGRASGQNRYRLTDIGRAVLAFERPALLSNLKWRN